MACSLEHNRNLVEDGGFEKVFWTKERAGKDFDTGRVWSGNGLGDDDVLTRLDWFRVALERVSSSPTEGREVHGSGKGGEGALFNCRHREGGREKESRRYPFNFISSRFRLRLRFSFHAYREGRLGFAWGDFFLSFSTGSVLVSLSKVVCFPKFFI